MASEGVQSPLDQRGLRTLVLWVGWAIASLMVFQGLYNKAGLWIYIREDQTRMTWVILAMFLLGTLISLAQAWLLTLEWFRAYRVEKYIAAHGIRALKPMRRRVVDRFFRALQVVIEKGAKPDIEGLIEVEYSAHHRASRMVALIGNLLITMGLIGTVFGLTITLSGLSGSLEALGENQEQLLRGLRHAMTGMGVAFYTTLLGSILGGILLRVFSQITDNSIEGVQDILMRSCLVDGADDLSPSLERDMRALNREMDRLEARIEKLHGAFVSSRGAMREFAEEVGRLQETARQVNEDENLLRAIATHRLYGRMLWREVQLRNRLRGWWGRLRYLVGVGK